MRLSNDLLLVKRGLIFQWAEIRKSYSHGTIFDFFSIYGATTVFMLRDGFDSNSHSEIAAILGMFMRHFCRRLH